MKLLPSPSLLSAIVLRRLFIAAANRRKIGEPESLGRSHGIRLDDGRCQPLSSPRWSWKADYYGMPEYNLRSYRAYMSGQGPTRSWEVLKRLGPRRLRVETKVLA
jgi:hypothetical protein